MDGNENKKVEFSLKGFKAVRANISAVGGKHPPNDWFSLCLGSVLLALHNC